MGDTGDTADTTLRQNPKHSHKLNENAANVDQ
jgi:hypothetical protein